MQGYNATGLNPRPGTLPHNLNPSNRRIASSLSLQVLLYYNVYFSLLWILATWWSLVCKHKDGIFFKDRDIVRTIFLCCWVVAEPFRLLAAYHGNLREKVPWMAVSFLLTCFPQTPTCLYLLLGQKDRAPFDDAINTIMILFLVPQIFLFLVTMRQIIKVHQRQFYLHDSSMFTNQLAFEQATPEDHYLVASQTAFGATNAQTTGSDNIVPTSTY